MSRSQVEFFHFVLDIALCVFALAISPTLRDMFSFGLPGAPTNFVVPKLLYFIVIGIWAVVFIDNRVYRRKFGAMFRYRLLTLLKSHMIAGFLFFGVLYLTYRNFSRLQSFYFIAVFVIGTIIARIIIRLVQILVFEDREHRFRVLILGTGINAYNLKRAIEAEPRHNLLVVGAIPFMDDETDGTHPDMVNRVIGNLDELAEIVENEKIDEVVIAPVWYSKDVSEAISNIMYQLQRFPVNIRLSPDYSAISFFQVVTENFQGVPILGLRTPVFSPLQRLLKRGLDLAITIPILIFGAPIFALIALIIRLDSPGPILLQQDRVGIHGTTFRMYKFRSMYNNIDQVKFDETHLDIIKRPNDPRVTRIGRLLRRTSLDELPQLLNVLKGEMSLVGPRPELPERVYAYKWWQYKRFEVPQGMTGWWQINGRANRPMHLHTEDDLYYIENYSLFLDVQILIQTLKVVITGEGAF